MKTISLSRGFTALVSNVDYPALSQHKWTAMVGQKGTHVYAYRRMKKDDLGFVAGKYLWMHLVILSKMGVKGDHRNGNTLDNRRRNLRPASTAQNAFNKIRYKNNRSGFKGVCWDKRELKWRATITRAGKQFHLGLFDAAVSAALAYDVAAKRLFGRFAKLNFYELI